MSRNSGVLAKPSRRSANWLVASDRNFRTEHGGRQNADRKQKVLGTLECFISYWVADFLSFLHFSFFSVSGLQTEGFSVCLRNRARSPWRDLIPPESVFRLSHLQSFKEKSYFLLNPFPVLSALFSLQHAVRMAHPDHNLCQLHSIRCPDALSEQWYKSYQQYFRRIRRESIFADLHHRMHT